MDVADRYEPGVMHLLTDNPQAAYDGLPGRINVRRIRKERERRLEYRRFRLRLAADNPRPFAVFGRVAMLRNSTKFCGVTWSTSPRRCNSKTAWEATRWKGSAVFANRARTLVSTK